MKINYECAACMQRQSREAIEYAVSSDDERMDITIEVISYLEKYFKKNTRSNKLGTDLHHMIMDKTGNHDPYKILREEGNKVALKLIPLVEDLLAKDDSLENYVKVAVAGNLIDFGALEATTDIEELIRSKITQDLTVNDVDKLEKSLRNSENILYLADNGGEIVFDKQLIKKIKEDYDVNIILALKESPILNDALVSDAKDLGIDDYATLISTGASSVGVVEEYVSDELISLMDSCDFIISKGMGNYEGLSEMKLNRPIYYMLTTKCSVISKEIGIDEGSTVLIRKDP
ncbi:MAG: ARMT1-like domain-containing protein [Methanosphaera sp.]|nr:ARMT1-like domain-containing protein [Methanosphaera sp.]